MHMLFRNLPRRGKMWRYKTELFDFDTDGRDGLNPYLAECGQDGWELVTVTPVRGVFLLVFKKRAS